MNTSRRAAWTHSAEAAYSRSSDLCCLGTHSPVLVVLAGSGVGWAIGLLLVLEGIA